MGIIVSELVVVKILTTEFEGIKLIRMDFKGLFLADIHCSKSRKDGCTEALDKLYKYVSESGSHGKRLPIFIAGDFFDAAMTVTDNSAYTDYLSFMNDLVYLTDVFMVYGTPKHEPNGCLYPFECIGVNVFDDFTYKVVNSQGYKFELIALPEPRKSNFISDPSKDINEVINSKFESFVDSLPEKTDIPRIVMGHNEIKGISFESGVAATSPIAYTPSTLKRIHADFYGFGHIHQKQEVFKNCWYIGTPYQKSFSETHDPGMMLVEINTKED